jgi:hypothetical protein
MVKKVLHGTIPIPIKNWDRDETCASFLLIMLDPTHYKRAVDLNKYMSCKLIFKYDEVANFAEHISI